MVDHFTQAVREDELDLLDKQRMVAIDIVKAWSFTFSGAAVITPIFRDGHIPPWGYVVLTLSFVLHILMVWFARWVR